MYSAYARIERAANGEIIAISEGYTSKDGCKNGIESVKINAPEAPVEDLFREPGHPYTRGLLSALPRLGRPVEGGRLKTIPGRVPEPGAYPAGCAFHPRCPDVMDICRAEEPRPYRLGAERTASCFLHRFEPEESPG